MDLSKSEQEIFEKLRWWRVETARAHNVPAYVIFQDATLREIAKAKPTTLDELRGVSGVGEKKLVSYGDEIVAMITRDAPCRRPARQNAPAPPPFPTWCGRRHARSGYPARHWQGRQVWRAWRGQSARVAKLEEKWARNRLKV
jgi:ribonuclease D